MKKKELIHLHGLLGTVAKDLVEEGVLSEEDLAEYADIGVSPMAIRRSRADHREAVLTLVALLAASVENDEADANSDAEHAVTT